MSPRRERGSKVTYLTPTRRADTNREDGKEPSVNFAKPGKECEEGGPYSDEKDHEKDDDLSVLESVGVGGVVVPQEGPVLSIGLGKCGLEANKADG